MHFENPPDPAPSGDDAGPWHRGLTGYHWFVLAVAALGWLFDTMDQQLFNLARRPAITELLSQPLVDGTTAPKPPAEQVDTLGGYATSIFIIGWALGGLIFGILGDKIGRARTMLLTILVYSLFTGLSALSVGVWDFALYRFLTGLGVGGEFAVGVALVAEVMPDRARPFALGWLQALSAVGNMTAALIAIVLGQLEEAGAIGLSSWRIMFVIGTVPALLAIVIRARLKEPERWKAVAHVDEPEAAVDGAKPAPRLGSLSELFGDPRWRRNTLVGMSLAFAGVVGLWGIGFFSFDLIRLIFRERFESQYVAERLAESGLTPTFLLAPVEPRAEEGRAAFLDRLAAASVEQVRRDGALAPLAEAPATGGFDALVFRNRPGTDLFAAGGPIERALELGGGTVVFARPQDTDLRIEARASKEVSGQLTLYTGLTSLLQNLGAFFGIYAFSRITHYTGRRRAFAVTFILAMLSTAFTFWFLGRIAGYYDVFWMIPIMGFCQIALFGGYAIYFPELFPTRLRSTGTSFCYNVGRLVAAVGPSALGLLTGVVFAGYRAVDPSLPMRYAGVTMCSVFLIGLIALPFAPETKGQPLPE